jgi:hypothetical protein
MWCASVARLAHSLHRPLSLVNTAVRHWRRRTCLSRAFGDTALMGVLRLSGVFRVSATDPQCGQLQGEKPSTPTFRSGTICRPKATSKGRQKRRHRAALPSFTRCRSPVTTLGGTRSEAALPTIVLVKYLSRKTQARALSRSGASSESTSREKGPGPHRLDYVPVGPMKAEAAAGVGLPSRGKAEGPTPDTSPSTR